MIDFIDMMTSHNQRDVENRLRDALKVDRARVQVGRISRFGLLEMSRQRLRLSLGESSQHVCPHCSGRGTIRSSRSLALSILRLIEEEALKEQTTEVQAQLPVAVATFMLNEKREAILALEKRHNINVLIIPNPYLEVPKYNIKRIKGDEKTLREQPQASYDLVENPELEITRAQAPPKRHVPEPAVKQISKSQRPKPESLLKRLWRRLFGAEKKPSETREKPPQRHHHRHRPHKPHQRRHRGGRGRQTAHARGEQGERGERGERGGRSHQQRQRGPRPQHSRPRRDNNE